MSRRSSPPLFVHPHHLNCVLLDPGSGCASPLSIDGIVFGVVTWSTSRISMVQVRQTVLDRYIEPDAKGSDGLCYVRAERSARLELGGYDQVAWLAAIGASV